MERKEWLIVMVTIATKINLMMRIYSIYFENVYDYL